MGTFKLKEMKPTRFGFGEGVKEAARLNEAVVGLGADITSSVSMDLFANAFPERFYSMGIAEQNIIGVAAGMALSGKVPFFSTYGVFAAMRTLDQIRISVCYNNVPVKIGGAHAGISVGPDGATHQALEDIAVMRSLPNMTVLSPCDATQTRLATIAAAELNGPVYIRFGREAVPDFTTEDFGFEIGKGQVLTEGSDVCIIATGHMVWEALVAAESLKKNTGISARVINIHTIKPIDQELIIKAARETGFIVTAEEHQIYGGLGSAVAEVLVKNFPVPVEMIGVNDRFGESGKPDELMEKYGLKACNIEQAVHKVLSRKKVLTF